MPCDAEEKYDNSLSPAEIVKYLAKLKAETVNKMVEDSIVLGADTIVSVDEHILGKPADKAEAYNMIKKLSGRWHDVITGICMYYGNDYIIDYVVTKVHFVDMSEEEIISYINTNEPYDKAGAYGVQGMAGMYIDSIEGDYYNIMGFPMAKIRSMLKSLSAIDGMKG